MITHAWNGMVRSCRRRARVPTRMTSGSSRRNTVMMELLNRNAAAPKQVSMITATFTQNQYASRTLSYLFAPKLKPHTGWKPWPKPMRLEFTNIINLDTMDMAAMAASP